MSRVCLAIALLSALAGCRNESQLGPFVKDVVRDGDVLVVKKCSILLQGGKELAETGCTETRIPLSAIAPAPK